MFTSKTISRRSAVALATALTAAFLTAVVGIGGLAGRSAAPPAGAHAVLVQAAPTAPATPEVDD
jgi:hypothetical protein